MNSMMIISTLLIVSMTSVLSEAPAWVNNQPVEWPQQSTGWQQPSSGWQQPSSGWQQPSSGWQQPSTGWQQTEEVQLTGGPNPVAFKPNAGWQQPTAVWQQPTTAWKQTEEVHLTGGPNPVAFKPNAGWQQPTAVWEQPGGGNPSEWDTGNYPARKPTITKHIYVHVPQPEKEEILSPRWIQPSPPNKHYKIIFIKTPDAQKLGPIKIPAQPQNEEKTLVYVLSKKPDTQQDIIVQPQVQTKPSKPEVFYIKYKTKSEQAKYGPPEHIPSAPKTDYGVPSH